MILGLVLQQAVDRLGKKCIAIKEKKIGNFGRFFGDFSITGWSGKKIHGKIV